MNWGYKILLVIISFVIAMVLMVMLAFRQNNEMIDTNYYEKEIGYQSYIEAAHKLNNVSSESIIKQDAQNLLVQIPVTLVEGFNNGNIEFIRNDNEKLDKNLQFKPDANGLFKIDKYAFSSGLYKARIKWSCFKTDYYREENLIIQK